MHCAWSANRKESPESVHLPFFTSLYVKQLDLHLDAEMPYTTLFSFCHDGTVACWEDAWFAWPSAGGSSSSPLLSNMESISLLQKAKMQNITLNFLSLYSLSFPSLCLYCFSFFTLSVLCLLELLFVFASISFFAFPLEPPPWWRHSTLCMSRPFCLSSPAFAAAPSSPAPLCSIGTREGVTQKNLSGLLPVRDFRLDPSLLYSLPLLALSPNLLIVWVFLSIAYLLAKLRCSWAWDPLLSFSFLSLPRSSSLSTSFLFLISLFAPVGEELFADDAEFSLVHFSSFLNRPRYTHGKELFLSSLRD